MKYLSLKCWATALLFAFTTLLVPGQEQSSKAADVVIFTNGDQLSGTLVREVKDSVVFKSDMAGELTIPLAKIRTLRTSGKFAVLRHGVSVDESRRVEPAEIEITASGLLLPKREAPPLPLNSVAYVVDAATFEKSLVRSPNFFSGWIGTATLGATMTQATQHGGTLTAAVAIARQVPILTYFHPRNRMIVNVEETYGTLTTPIIPQTAPASPDAVVKTSIFHADVERDEYVSKRSYLLAFASFDHNFAQGLDLQQLYGAGFGLTPFSDEVQQLDLKADVHYAKQQFFDQASNQDLIGSSFSENYRRSLPAKIQFTQSLNVIPAWNSLKAYSANGSAMLALPVINRFSFSSTAADAFLNNPSAGYRKNSFTFTAGITYALK